MSTAKQGVVNIKGKDYKTVALRVAEFREKYPNYYLTTEIVKIDDDQCIIKAYVGQHKEDGSVQTFATGHAQEFRKASQINGTSYVENCETSAIGRALACLGIGGTEFASANEVLNAIHQQNNPVVEKVSDEDLEVIKGQLTLSHEAGELKQAFHKLSPYAQEKLRDFANDLRKAA
jgi:hypothetical protein